MIRANVALSNGKAEEAISHYTEVLYKLSPAHVCAFLNRSMAYIESGYYELAVMDAFRACITAHELGEVRPFQGGHFSSETSGLFHSSTVSDRIRYLAHPDF